jgi:hypothetical protein
MINAPAVKSRREMAGFSSIAFTGKGQKALCFKARGEWPSSLVPCILTEYS